MAGTEVPVPSAQANKTADELKLEEKNDVRYCTLLLAMDSKGKAFSKVANAKPANQLEGCLKKAYDKLKATYAPNNTMEIMMLKQDFANCALENGKTNPDMLFNELDNCKMRLGIVVSDILDEDMIAHLTRKVVRIGGGACADYKSYEPSAGYSGEPQGSNQGSLQVYEAKWSYQEGA